MIIRNLLLGAAALTIDTATPRPDLLPDEVARMLNPLAQLSFRCGGGRERADLLQSRIKLAMASGAMNGAVSSNAPPLIAGLKGVSMTITSSSERAQAFFNQGLALAYGFNHDAAIRSFREAQRLDPACAMCFWGEAYARGPNINAPMDPAGVASTMTALSSAIALRSAASPREQALIDALAVRYSADPGADRAALDKAYADAMRAVAERFAEDDDIAILAVEAAMDTQPWDYWESDGRTPKGRTAWSVAEVEKVLARSPNHPQAIHLYIHLLEASKMPQKAEAAADRLARPLVPAAGHLVHMPGHLFFRLGRFKDAIAVNVAAARADEDYLRTSDDRGLYRFGYYPHNVHFIVTSAQMGGDKATAIDQAKRLQQTLGIDVAVTVPWVQVIWAAPYFAHAQFSSPAEILAQPVPDKRLPYVTGMYHYARAVAFAWQRDRAGVEREITQLREVAASNDWTAMKAGGVPAPDLLQLAQHVARGRLAMASGKPTQAIRHYRAAIAIEDQLPYMEPPYWYYPVRQSLGAAQLVAGDAAGARQTFLDALARSPNNGWALYGLGQAQQRLGEKVGRRFTQAALQKAWLGRREDLSLSRL